MTNLLVIGGNDKAGLAAALMADERLRLECIVEDHCQQVDVPVEMTFEFDAPALEAFDIFHEKKPRRSGQKRNRWR